VKSYAASQGLHPDEYKLVGTFDEKTERIRLTFGTTKKIDIHKFYVGIFQEIRRSFPDFPEITMFIGLVVKVVDHLDEVEANFIVAEDQSDLTDLLERL
jgi:hypothetical protein